MKKAIFFIFLSTLGYMKSYGQNVIAASGNSATNGNTMLDWTVGESIITTHQTANNFLSQGFHQPNYQIVPVSEVEEKKSVLVYPNPSTDAVFIESSEKINWTLFDISGRVLEKNTSQIVQMHLYVSGIYVLKVQQKQKETIFQIIKP